MDRVFRDRESDKVNVTRKFKNERGRADDEGYIEVWGYVDVLRYCMLYISGTL